MGEMAGKAAVAENKNKSGDGNASTVVVLNVDLHCRGCASKILKYVRGFEGVVDTKVVKEANELMVEGKFDTVKLREMLLAKTKKKVEIVPISLQKQQQKKEKDKDEKSINGGSKGDAGNSKTSQTKPKELPVITVVFKLGGLDCQGCIAKINRIIGKTAGVHNFVIEKDKGVLTVKGVVDTKTLADKLKEKMRRSVEIVPQKKEKEVAGDGKKNGGGGCKAEEKDGVKFEGSRMEYYGPPQSQLGYGNGMGDGVGGYGPPQSQPGYGNGMGDGVGGYSYGFMYGEPVHAPQLFSDENPNACCVM